MPTFLPTFAAMELDFVSGVVGVLVAIGVSFALITLVASYFRFESIVKIADSTQPEDMGATAEAVLHVQLARFLAHCGRLGTSFSIALVKLGDTLQEVRMESPAVQAVKRATRRDDVACIYDEQTIAVLLESDPEDAVNIFSRISAVLAADCADIDSNAIRVGIASYPGHGLSGKLLVHVACDGLAQTDADTPIIIPEITDYDEEDETEEGEGDAAEGQEEAVPAEEPEDSSFDEEAKSWKDRRKSAMLDELTGVLKPSAISPYMQRLMSEIRQKHKRASLFCIGVNNMDYITRFHGEFAADDVLAAISRILQNNLRGGDLIGRHEKNAFLALVAASLDEAEAIGKRISKLVQKAEIISEGKKLRTSITVGVSAYPEHGRNLHQLYKAGQQVLDHNRINDIRAYAVYDPAIHASMPSKPMRSIKSIQAD